MIQPNDGGPAFPFGQISESTGQPINGYLNEGMSLRDYFAAAMWPAVFARARAQYAFAGRPENWRARMAVYVYRQADELLKARDVKEQP